MPDAVALVPAAVLIAVAAWLVGCLLRQLREFRALRDEQDGAPGSQRVSVGGYLRPPPTVPIAEAVEVLRLWVADNGDVHVARRGGDPETWAALLADTLDILAASLANELGLEESDVRDLIKHELDRCHDNPPQDVEDVAPKLQ